MSDPRFDYPPDEFCVGEWCTSDRLNPDRSKDPLQSIRIIEDLVRNIPQGPILSVDMSIACSPDYISYYTGIEGMIQILEGVFQPTDEASIMAFEKSNVMFSLSTNYVPGFLIPLLTIRLDFIPEDGDKTILQEIEYLISENSPRICGYLSEVRVVEIKSQQDANLFITKRMTTRENFRFSKDTLSLLGRSEIFRWIQYIDTLPTMFNGNELLDFRWSRMGMSMKNVDLVLSDFLRDSLHN